MKKLFFSVFVVFLCCSVSAQFVTEESGHAITPEKTGETKVFESYEDYLQGKGRLMGDQYVRMGSGTQMGDASNDFVKLKSPEGEVIKFKYKDIWGFYFKGQLFRTAGKELAMLMDSGRVYYWINGTSGLNMLSKEDYQGGIAINGSETPHFLSKGRTDKIYKMPSSKGVKRDFKVFSEENPEYQGLCDCFDISSNLITTFKSIQQCVIDFNQKKGKR